MSWSDQELALLLEGLLDPAVAAALADDLLDDPALARRHAALRELLAPPVTLPPLAPPAGLAARVDARLAALPGDAALADALEELPDADGEAPARDRARAAALADAIPAPVALRELPAPPGLLGRTLARLTAEGLIAAASVAAGLGAAGSGDARLAAHLEGLLPEDEALELERALARDPALRARHAGLAALFDERAALPELAAPAPLASRVVARLLAEGAEPEGLLDEDELHRDLEDGDLDHEALPALEPPAGLLAATLGRIEASGLIASAPAEDLGSAAEDLEPAAEDLEPAAGTLTAPALAASDGVPARSGAPAGDAAPRGRLLSFPLWVPAAIAAALLLGAGLGLVLGRGAVAAAPGGELASALAASQGETARLRGELAGQVRALEGARGEASAARAALARAEEAVRRAGAGADERPGLRAELARQREALAAAEARAERAAKLEGELEARAQDALRAREALARSEGALAQLRGEHERERDEHARVRGELLAARTDLARLEQARSEAEAQRAVAVAEARRLQVALDEVPAGMPVASAGAVERWDPRGQAWRPVGPREELSPGTLVRGRRVESVLQVADLPPYQLRTNVYVVRDRHRLDPLPAALTTGGGARFDFTASTEAPQDLHALVEQLASDSAVEASAAQEALRELYVRHGGTGTPPTTAHGWERWWSREGSRHPR
ncbi:MAG: hypothetical protein AB7N76_23005 [Planctomycetota bacterium]